MNKQDILTLNNRLKRMECLEMYEREFPKRLAMLRMRRGVSARDMSLSLGQNQGYIHNIESGKALPSMQCFFHICDYLEITPSEFFDWESNNPQELNGLITNLKQLDDEYLNSVSTLVRGLL